MEKIACVKHRNGWCACAGKTIRYRDQVKTLCSHYIVLPFRLEFRQPNYQKCLEIIAAKRRANSCL